MTQHDRDEIRALVLSFSTRISDLPEVEALYDSDYITVVQNDGSRKHSRKATFQSLLELIKVHYPDNNGAKYQGVAHPGDANVRLPIGTDGFWFAIEPGVYTNYGGIVVGNSPKILYYDVVRHEWRGDTLWGEIGGTIHVKFTREDGVITTKNIPVVPSSTYTFGYTALPAGSAGRAILREYDENGNPLDAVEFDTNPKTITTHQSAYYAVITVVDDVSNPINTQSSYVEASATMSVLVEALYRYITDVLAEGIMGEITALQNGLASLTIEADRIAAQVSDLDGNVALLEITSRQILARVSNAEGDIAELYIRADEIGTRVSNAEGDISTLTQRANSITAQVINAEGEIATLQITANQITSQVQNMQGDISILSQTAGQISARVSNAEDDIAELTITATQISSRVSDAEGNITVLQQTSTALTARLENTEGDITALEVTATGLAARVSDSEDNIYSLTITATQLESRMQSAEGNISTLTQTAEAITARVQDDEDNISQLQITSTEISARVSTAEDDITELTITAEGLTTRVTTAEGNIHELDLTATSLTSRITTAEGNITEINQDINSIELSVQALTGSLSDYETITNAALQDLQDQIDGAIDTWFYNGTPTLNNLPASEWTTTALKDMHIGDIYYDNESGYAYRFTKDSSTGTYSWTLITDSAVVDALARAARAQDTADHKRRVFITTPYPPYDAGDLWVKERTVNNTTVREIYRCITSRADGVFSAADWGPASDYATEISKANLEILSNAIAGTVATYTYDSEGKLTSNTVNLIQQTANDTVLTITGTELQTVGIYIHNASASDNHIDLIADKVNIKGTGDHTPTALAIVWDSTDQKYKIDVASLNVTGIFSTSAWSSQLTSINNTAQGYANTAQSNAESYANGVGASTLASAETYADGIETTVKAYADNVGSASVQSAQTYFNNIVYGEGGSEVQPVAGSILYMINGLDTDFTALDDQINTTGGLADQIQAATQGLTDLGYLAEALYDGDTVVAGGLIVSSLIQLGSKTYNNQDTPIRNSDGTATPGTLDQSTWKVWSGINGVYVTSESSAYGHGIAAWYGGAMLDRYYSGNTDANRAAKSLFRFDGSGYLASNKLRWDASGNLTVDGYILTNEVQLKDNNGNIKAGISGAYDSTVRGGGVAAWFGGPKVDHLVSPSTTPYAASLFRMDGSGYLAGGELEWGASGELIIHGQSTEHPVTIENAVLTQGNLSITIGDLLELKSWFAVETYDKGDNQIHKRLKLVGSGTGIEGLHVEGHILSDDDQIVGSGTPGTGGGGGGGSPYLYELLDVDNDLVSPDAGSLLYWGRKNGVDQWIGSTITNLTPGDILIWEGGVWKNKASSLVGGVTSVAGRTGAITLTTSDITNIESWISGKNYLTSIAGLTFGSKTFNGTQAQTLLAEDINAVVLGNTVGTVTITT